MACGLCGSGITADEKFKKFKDGITNRYVYYGCTKFNDKNCKCGHINEEALIIELQKLIDKIDINEISIKEKIKEEFLRFKKFQRCLLGISSKIKVSNIDIHNYIKYIFSDGLMLEKREVLGCIKNNIFLSQKKISIS